jgi:hypothetical protein
MDNRADFFKPIYASHIGPAPVVVRAVITSNQDSIAGGVPQAALKGESYVLLSALPKELQERVKTAVQALISGM